MKKKNGFISTTVVYTFFFVFLMLLLFIIGNYSQTRSLLRIVKKDAKTDISDTNLARYLINHYNESGINMDNHNSFEINGANDNSYRFTGANPNNYLCLDNKTSGSCSSTNNMYRIIGVFGGRLKVVKYTNLGSLAWNSALNVSNYWWDATLLGYLNETYLNTLGTYTNIIEDTTWRIGGFSNAYMSQKAQIVYNFEVGEMFDANETITKKIGLLYVSDYAFASLRNTWNTNLGVNTSSFSSNNWLANLTNSWFLSRVVEYSNYSYYIGSTGALSYDVVNQTKYVYPVFYLKSSVRKLLDGNGTYNTPYRIG